MSHLPNNRYRYLAFSSSTTYRRYIAEDATGKDTTPAQSPTDNSPEHVHGSYAGTLFKPEWKQKREEILTRDGHCCVICKKNNGLQVHHRQYHFVIKENKFKLPWEYPNDLLITLCESCHSRGHNKYKVPIINI